MNIFNINIINQSIIKYYKDNIEIAIQDYFKLTTNDRGLDKSKLDGYYEYHHKIPKCMGGLDLSDNLVLLTYKEHIIAHMLLYIIYPKITGLMVAFKSMTSIKSIHDIDLEIDLEVKTKLRAEFSSYISGENNPMKREDVVSKFKGENSPSKRKEFREKLSKIRKENNPMKNPETIEKMRKSKIGKKQSIEVRMKLSELRVGRKMSEEQKKLISEQRKLKNIHLSEESKDKMRESKKSKYKGPDGTIYNSISSAARSAGVSRTTMKYWIDNYPEKGFTKISL